MSIQEIDLIVLKNLITNKKFALEFVGEADAKIFSVDVWNFANTIVSYIKNHKELPTLRVLSEKLNKPNNEKLLEHIHGVWGELDEIQVKPEEYKHFLNKLKARYSEEQILLAKNQLAKIEPGSFNVDKTISDIQKVIQNVKSIKEAKSFERRTIKDSLAAFTERFNARKNNPELDVGIKTGYAFFDQATNGIKGTDFILICGESGFGKSLVLNNMAIQIWMQGNKIEDTEFKPGKNVIYFSLEMNHEDCFNRLLSRLAGVASHKIENATLDRDEMVRLKKALDFIKRYPNHFEIVDIPDASANDIDAIIDDCTFNVDVAVIDYLGIMKPNEGNSDEQDWLKQGIISYETRGIARRRNIPVFSAVQLNRKTNASKDPSENIGLARLARSATIATHATHVLQIESRPQEEQHFDLRLHLIKNRKGPKTQGKLVKNFACATLLDIEQEESAETDINKQFIQYNMDDISEEIEDLEIEA